MVTSSHGLTLIHISAYSFNSLCVHPARDGILHTYIIRSSMSVCASLRYVAQAKIPQHQRCKTTIADRTVVIRISRMRKSDSHGLRTTNLPTRTNSAYREHIDSAPQTTAVLRTLAANCRMHVVHMQPSTSVCVLRSSAICGTNLICVRRLQGLDSSIDA